MNLAIVIPTFNRLSELQRLISSIQNQVIPRGLTLTICLSGAYCSARIKSYLRNLEGNHQRVNIIVNIQALGPPNWCLAAGLVPSDFDYAWMVGDDDELIGSRSISQVFSLLNRHPNIDALFVPMASRAKEKYLIEDTFFHICNRIGFHEAAGWISSSIVKVTIFKQVYTQYCEIFTAKIKYFRQTPSLSRSLYEQKIGQFTHTTCMLDILFKSTVIFASIKIVKEQNSQRGLLDTLNRDKIKRLNKKYHSARFIFDLQKISQTLKKHKCEPDPVFFKYVSRDYFQLCYDILLDGITTNEYSQNELMQLLSILDTSLISSSISYIKSNKVMLLYIENLYHRLNLPEERIIDSGIQDLWELVKLREYPGL